MIPYSSPKLKFHKSLTRFLIQFFYSSSTVPDCPNVELVLFTEAQILKLIDEKLVGPEWEQVLVVDKLPAKPPQGDGKDPDPAKEPAKKPEGEI